MRANSQEHVERCEATPTPTSQWRCSSGGRCHGRRLVVSGGGREAYEALPADDPHHLQTAADRSAAAREKLEHERAEQLNRGRRAHIEDVRRRSPRHAAELEERWFASA